MLYKLFFKKCNDPPKYFKLKKYYTMGPGIDFPLIMNYTDTNTGYGEPYFYFLNGHGDVTYFADTNFIEEEIESYEYNFFGISNSIGNKNFLLYNGFEYDLETNLYRIGTTFYNPSMGLVLKDLKYGREAVPRAMPFLVYPEKMNEVIVSMMPVDEVPPEPMLPPIPAPFCGNGKRESGEQCDDGNTNDNDCCDTNCKDTGNCRPYKPSPVNCNWTKTIIIINGTTYIIWICVPFGPE